MINLNENLLFGAFENNLQDVVTALKCRADINAQTEAGWTALMFAACNGNIEIARMLIQSGAEVNSLKPYSDTALMIACGKKNPEMVKLLLEAGADVNEVNSSGFNALIFATIASKGDDYINQLLNIIGFSKKTSDKNQDEMPKLEAKLELSEWEEQEIYNNKVYKEIVYLLLSYKANLESRDIAEWTALMHAVVTGTVFQVELLIEFGADINTTACGLTPLMLACQNKDFDKVIALLEAGAKINVQDSRGNTALFHIIKNRFFNFFYDYPMINLLIKHGADIEIKDNEDKTAFVYLFRIERVDNLVLTDSEINALLQSIKTPNKTDNDKKHER